MDKSASLTKIEFPFRLDSKLQSVALADDVHLRRMDDADRLRIFGLEDVKFDENDRIKSFVKRSEPPLGGGLHGPLLDDYDQLYSSNYLATLPSRDVALDFNFALKLLGSSCSSLYIGHQHPGASHFLSPPCYLGAAPLRFELSESKTLSSYLSLKRSSTNARLVLMADMYLYAMSKAPRKESRFIDLSVILEMLLLPTASTELSYRFALRAAKLLEKRSGKDPVESFATAQRIYKTRSRLVHSGHDRTLEKVEPQLDNLVRMLLAMYLEQPGQFEESVLDALCIAG